MSEQNLPTKVDEERESCTQHAIKTAIKTGKARTGVTADPAVLNTSKNHVIKIT